MKVITEATVTNTCDGVVGSFSSFNRELKEKGFAGKRVIITYELKEDTNEHSLGSCECGKWHVEGC